MLKRLSLTVLLLPCWAAAETIHYNDLPRLILSNNRVVAAEKTAINAQAHRQGHLLRSYLPKFDARAGYESFEPGSNSSTNDLFWRTEASINLLRGGQDRQESAVRRLQKTVAELDLENSRRLQLLQARQLYWHIVALKEFIRVQNKALEDNPKHLKVARRRVASGHATSSDPIEFELQQTSLEQDFKRLTLDLDKAKNQLTVILALSNHELLEVADGFTHPPDHELQDSLVDYDKTPQVQMYLLEGDILKADARKNNRAWWPQVDLFSALAKANDFDTTALSSHDITELDVGLRLQIDFADAATSAREAKAKDSLAAGAQLKGAHQQSAVAAQVHELKHDMNLLHDLLHDADKSVVQAQKFLELTLEEYGRGAKNGRDVLEAAQKQIKFEHRLYELYRDYYITRSELLAFIE